MTAEDKFKKPNQTKSVTSLGVQWTRIRLPMQRTQKATERRSPWTLSTGPALHSPGAATASPQLRPLRSKRPEPALHKRSHGSEKPGRCGEEQPLLTATSGNEDLAQKNKSNKCLKKKPSLKKKKNFFIAVHAHVHGVTRSRTRLSDWTELPDQYNRVWDYWKC